LDGCRFRGSRIESASFTWFVRHTSGVLRRLSLEVRDAGLSENWKRYDPIAQVILESVVVEQRGPPGP